MNLKAQLISNVCGRCVTPELDRENWVDTFMETGNFLIAIPKLCLKIANQNILSCKILVQFNEENTSFIRPIFKIGWKPNRNDRAWIIDDNGSPNYM